MIEFVVIFDPTKGIMRSVNRAHLYFPPTVVKFHCSSSLQRDEAPKSLGTPQLGSNRVLHTLEPLATWHRSLYGPLIEDIKETEPRVQPLFTHHHHAENILCTSVPAEPEKTYAYCSRPKTELQ